MRWPIALTHSPPGMDLIVLDVLADRPHSGAAAVASLVTAKHDGTTIDDINASVRNGRAQDLMIETYRYFVSLPSAHASYRRLLTEISLADGAVVIHCTAGKDRTGWALAVLQRLCGASIDDVMGDYLASNAPMEAAYRPLLDTFAAEGGDAQALGDMIFVRPEYLDASVTLMKQVHGGLDSYLTTALGLSPATVTRLRDRLSG